LSGFLLRNKKVYAGQSNWTQAHFRWLERIIFDSPIQQIVFQEYVDVGETPAGTRGICANKR